MINEKKTDHDLHLQSFSKGFLHRNTSFIEITKRIFDFAVISSAGVATYALRHEQWTLPSFYIHIIMLAAIMFLAFSTPFAVYRNWRGTKVWREIFVISLNLFVSFGLLMAIIFMTKMGDYYSRIWYFSWLLSSWGVIVFFRVNIRLLLTWMRLRGYNHRRIVIVGTRARGKYILRQLQQAAPWAGLDIIGFFHCDPDHYQHFFQEYIENVPVLGTSEDLGVFFEQTRVDQIWIALPSESKAEIEKNFLRFRNAVEIYYEIDSFIAQYIDQRPLEIAGIPVIKLNDSPRSIHNFISKKITDYVLSSFLLILTLPLFALISIGVKLSSPGPVFFKQKRFGLDGEPIEVLKFRTMRKHKEAEGQVTQATKKDSRVTRFGAFLRRSSLDELPQLINILQGRMALVGPRPHAVEHNKHYQPLIHNYMLRHKVTPGITGWAQVNGLRGQIDTLEKMEKRVAYDLEYIEKWSIWFDLKIVFLTFFSIIDHFYNKKAY